jgi:hypothetical protein
LSASSYALRAKLRPARGGRSFFYKKAAPADLDGYNTPYLAAAGYPASFYKADPTATAHARGAKTTLTGLKRAFQ